MIINKTSTIYRNARTLNGIPFDVAKSAIQKYIRRGIVDKAQYIMADMYMMHWNNIGFEGYITNFFNRLRIIYLEDIGIAAPTLLYMVNDVLNTRPNTKLSPQLPYLIKCMSTSLHSRCYSHIRAWWKTYKPISPPSPKFKYSLGMDEDLRQVVDNFIWCMENKEISAYYWMNQIMDIEKLKVKRPRSTRPGFLIFDIIHKLKMIPDRKTYDICVEWYKNMKMKEQFLCVMHPVMLYILGDHVSKYNPNPITDKYDYNAYNKPLLNYTLELDTYVYDKHTLIGKRMGRSYSDFAVEGSLVAYDLDLFPKLSQNYMDDYLKIDKPPSEAKEYTLKARTQLTTGNYKPDVYFATNTLGQNVVVKGPYTSKVNAMMPFKLHNIMLLFDSVNTYGINIRLLYPDLWDKVGLGARNTVGKNYQYFVIMDDILNQTNYPTKIRSSKVWKDEVVVDYDALFKENPNMGFGIPSEMSEKARFSLLIQLTFRLVFQIGDNSYRNFIRVDDTVYNIDLENVMGIWATIKFSQAEIDILNTTRAKYWSEYSKILELWLGEGDGYYNKWDICASTLPIDIDKMIINIKHLLILENILKN